MTEESDVPLPLRTRMRNALALGAGLVNEEAREAIAGFVRRTQRPDGGFGGRDRKPDLYYTAFAVELLGVLSDRSLPADTLDFVNAIDFDSLDLVYLACLARCINRFELRDHVLRGRGHEVLERFRARDGGYDLKPGADHGSAYGVFLATLMAEDLGGSLPDRDAALALETCLRASPLDHWTAPNLSAAVLALHHAGRPVPEALPSKLAALDHRHGGFRAGVSTRFPDLLSTGVTLFALATACASAVDPLTLAVHREYVELLWQDDGGFAGHVADGVSDCEYTYYALMALGSLVQLSGPLPSLD